MTAIVAVSDASETWIAADTQSVAAESVSGDVTKILRYSSYYIAFAGDLNIITRWAAEPPEDPPEPVTQRWLHSHWAKDVNQLLRSNNAIVAFDNGQIAEYDFDGALYLIKRRRGMKGITYAVNGSGWEQAAAAIVALLHAGERRPGMLAEVAIRTAIALRTDCGGKVDSRRVR